MGEFEHLLRSQTAQVGELVGVSGLDPHDFEWRAASYEPYVIIPEFRHTPSNSRFQFTYSRKQDMIRFGAARKKGRHHAKFTPGEAEEWEDHNFLEWEQVRSYVEQWLRYISRELQSETYWEAVVRGTGGISGHAEEPGDEPFEEAEASNIKEALDDALARVAVLELRAEDYEFVRGEVDELKESLKTMRRRGWAKMALGTFVNLTVRQVISTDGFREAWELVMRHLEDLPGMLPPGP